jgi:hypothetical protein
MTDVLGAGSQEAMDAPSADVFRRAGLTGREAERLASSEALRRETRSPWEAAPFGILLWALWRLVYKGFQPLWLLASLALVGWFATQGVIQSGGIRNLTEDAPDLELRIQDSLMAAVPIDRDAQEFWQTQMQIALDGDRRRRPDIETYRAWAAIGPDLIGREQLALQILAQDSTVAEMDARLRTGPAWDRERALDLAWRSLTREAARRDLEPMGLILVPEALDARYQSSLFIWSIAQTSAETFFERRANGQLELTSLAGLVREGAADTRLYGGMRHLVMQTCAQARITGEPLLDCEAGIIPVRELDSARYALAAIEVGAVRLSVPGRAVRDGAEILSAAHAAGRLHPQLAAELNSGLALMLPAARVSDHVRASDMRLDLAYAAPRRASGVSSSPIDLRTGPEAASLSRLLETVSRLRRYYSPTITMRLLSGVRSAADMEQLLRLAPIADDRLLGMQLMLGEGVYDLLQDEPAPRQPERRVYHGLIAGLISSAMVVLLTILRLSTPVLIRRAGWLNGLDASLSRLFLGRKT